MLLARERRPSASELFVGSSDSCACGTIGSAVQSDDGNESDNSRASLLMVPASRSGLTFAIAIGANGDDARRNRAALIPDWRSFSF